jgi:hypothetical protein
MRCSQNGEDRQHRVPATATYVMLPNKQRYVLITTTSTREKPLNSLIETKWLEIRASVSVE